VKRLKELRMPGLYKRRILLTLAVLLLNGMPALAVGYTDQLLGHQSVADGKVVGFTLE